MGQVHLAMPLRQILLMQRLDPGQVVLEPGCEGGGKGGETVLIALARTDGQLFHRNIDVLDPESDGFHNTQAAPIEQFGDQLGGASHAAR